MDWIHIGLIPTIILLILWNACSLLVIICGYANRKHDRLSYEERNKKENKTFFNQVDAEVYAIWALIFFIVFIVLGAATFLYAEHRYSGAYNLPQDYIEANNTVEEIEELLLRHENRTADNSTTISNIDLALESEKMKQKLTDVIIRKNKLRAEINSWLNNPMTPYKQRLRSQLPEDFEYS